MRWTMEQVAGALGVALPAALDPVARVAGVSIDSRTVAAGELFFAIRGPRHDGHDFAGEVLGRGVPAAVVEAARRASYPEAIRGRLFPVEDTLLALQQLAAAVLWTWRDAKPERRVAAVSGSVGKTTTKEILAALLGTRFRTLKSTGNLNNLFGVPLMLARLDEQDEAAVIEMGMSRVGEIARLAWMSRPEVGVVTRVAPVHLEFFASVDEIAVAKRELVEGLAGDEPVAVLNADDPRVARFHEIARGRVLTFGLGAEAEFRARAIEDRGAEGSTFE